MSSLQDAVAEAGGTPRFSGVVRVHRAGETELCTAYGFADRAHGIPATVDTQFGTASGTKGLTALAVMALVERGLSSSAPPPVPCSARTCRWSATT